MDQKPEWPEVDLESLSDDALQEAASEVIFERGRAYAASGAVVVVSAQARPRPRPGLRARVSGTTEYATAVWIEDDAIDGRCDCPNAADGWFCKHQVAVALVWRAGLNGVLPVVAGARDDTRRKNVRRVKTVTGKHVALRDFLLARDVPTLAEKLMAVAYRDRRVATELQHWRKLVEASGRTTDLKPLITQLLTVKRGFVAWDQIATFVQEAEAVLPLLRQATAQDANEAVMLGLHALRRLWKVLGDADDSNGEISELCIAVGGEWVLSLQAAGEQPAKFGETWLQACLDDPIDCFDTGAIEQAIGETAMRRYRRDLATRWRSAKDAVRAQRASRAAKPRAMTHDVHTPVEIELWVLERLHLEQLEAMGQVDDVLAVLREDLSRPDAHSTVVGYLEQHGRFREAFVAAEQGLKAFPEDGRLQEQMLACYERDGWVAESHALRRQQFEQRPTVQSYHQVLETGRAAGQDEPALRQELLGAVAAREPLHLVTSSFANRAPVADRAGPRDVSLRAEILCSESRWHEADALVEPPSQCRDEVLIRIARHLQPDRNDRALVLLRRVFDRAMHRATTPYRQELALVLEIAGLMAPSARHDWLKQLRVAFKAKRNFVRGLPER